MENLKMEEKSNFLCGKSIFLCGKVRLTWGNAKHRCSDFLYVVCFLNVGLICVCMIYNVAGLL